MANVVSIAQPNDQPSVSVAIGNDSDVSVVVPKGSTAPKPKQPDVVTIVNRNVGNVFHSGCKKFFDRHSVCGWIVNIMCLTAAIYQIYFGAINLHNCPVERFIPIWIVVGGVLYLVEMILQVFDRLNSDNDKLNGCGYLLLRTFLVTCLFAWCIPGSVWVYGVWHKVSYNSCDPATFTKSVWVKGVCYKLIYPHSCDAANYCREWTFMFATLQITLTWSLLALIMFGFIGCFIYTRVTAAVASNNPAPINTPPHLVNTQLPSISL